MSVLTLPGGAINWRKPPKPTTRVLWSRRDMYGRPVTGSLRTIAHLDHLDTLARQKFGTPIVVIQPPYNRGVAASAGTHDLDACSDLYIPGVPWRTQEKFFRANGFACWWRRPPSFGNHIHGFTLPPAEGRVVSDDFKVGGFKVGKYVDGGFSLLGGLVTSSQIADYYEHRTGLSGHAFDTGSWFPPNIRSTIFDLNAYIAKQKGPTPVVNKPLMLSWNVLTGRKAAQVRKEITSLIQANHRPKFVALQEVSTYRAPLRNVATSLRYKRFQPNHAGPKAKGVDARESGSTALLVRNGVPIREHGVIRCEATWLGPWHRRVREGRVFPWVVAKIAGRWTLVVAVHMPTGKNSKANEAAWDESIMRVERLAKEKGLPYLIIGDWNDRWTSTDKRSPDALAKRTGGKVLHTNTNIDYALVKGQSLRMNKGSKRGSDHPVIRVYRKKA